MKVSIITATYNSEKTIQDTVLSVSRQDYVDIEHIIVDGESSDKTLAIINNCNVKDLKIISEPDEGIYDAFNKGIKNSTGDIIGFLHSDDIFFDDTCITRLVDALKTNNCDAVYGNLEYVSKENINNVIRFWKSKKYNMQSFNKGWMPPHPTFFVRKKIYEDFGCFDTTYKISGDYEIIVRFLLKYKISATYLNYVITKMRIGGTSNSLINIKLKLKEDMRVMRKFKINRFFGLMGKNISKINQFF